MRPVLHLGPSKTASTSLQQVIPLLGRPYIIKPDWAKSLREGGNVTLNSAIPAGLIVSDEGLGDFTFLPPHVISLRLLQLFGPSIIVYVQRDSKARLHSLYRQALKNGAHNYASYEHFDEMHRNVHKKLRGHYMTQDIKALTVAFHPHEFRVVQFSHLNDDPKAFLAAFCAACEAPVPTVDLPHLNEGTGGR